MMRLYRKKIGWLLAGVALAALPILAFAGAPLLTGSSAYVIETGVTTHSLHWHWPLVVVAALFIAGIALALFPSRQKDDSREGR